MLTVQFLLKYQRIFNMKLPISFIRYLSLKFQFFVVIASKTGNNFATKHVVICIQKGKNLICTIIASYSHLDTLAILKHNISNLGTQSASGKNCTHPPPPNIGTCIYLNSLHSLEMDHKLPITYASTTVPLSISVNSSERPGSIRRELAERMLSNRLLH